MCIPVIGDIAAGGVAIAGGCLAFGIECFDIDVGCLDIDIGCLDIDIGRFDIVAPAWPAVTPNVVTVAMAASAQAARAAVWRNLGDTSTCSSL
ncbi:MAG TPA: hypothetical protein VHZ75_02680 [Solirubrobacteraceae bacterium]|jgi:hypothetical protein|nr:hypothetical protein [Solirubrobacteraceae bacterium]